MTIISKSVMNKRAYRSSASLKRTFCRFPRFLARRFTRNTQKTLNEETIAPGMFVAKANIMDKKHDEHCNFPVRRSLSVGMRLLSEGMHHAWKRMKRARICSL